MTHTTHTHTFIDKEKVHIDLWDLLEEHVIGWLREHTILPEDPSSVSRILIRPLNIAWLQEI